MSTIIEGFPTTEPSSVENSQTCRVYRPVPLQGDTRMYRSESAEKFVLLVEVSS